MIIRPSIAEDMGSVGTLVRASFTERLHRFMTYAQPGIAAFLRAIVEQPKLFPDHHLLTCTDPAGTVTGFAEFRIDGTTALLSYICIAPTLRRAGLATRMIEAFLDRHSGLARLELDVFEDNEPALRLYERMGFAGAARSLWLARDLPAAAGAVRAVNPAGAIVAFARYGFCEMPVRWDGQEHRLGRIGAHTLRCFSAADFDDEVLLAAVRNLLPKLDTALLILPVDQAGQRSKHVVNASRRLSLDLQGHPPKEGGA
jgi:ribosomal protein S18 acetylase RimI-like enzyme